MRTRGRERKKGGADRRIQVALREVARMFRIWKRIRAKGNALREREAALSVSSELIGNCMATQR